MIQLVKGFKELQKSGVIHRDLKPANILTHRGTVKLADFGLAKYVDNYGSSMLRSCVGSPLYMAPQVLMKKAYTTKCDIWSLGVLYFEMLFKEFPFNGKNEADLLKNIVNSKYSLKPAITYTRFSEEFLKRVYSILCIL
jgi:calcium-dependent protein kinase